MKYNKKQIPSKTSIFYYNSFNLCDAKVSFFSHPCKFLLLIFVNYTDKFKIKNDYFIYIRF